MALLMLILLTMLTCTDFLKANYNTQEYSWIEAAVWESVEPHLLPEELPVKNELDKIFGKNRVTASIGSMEKAGFRIIPMRNKRKVIAKHPAIKGYLIKTYLDCHQIPTKDWIIWTHRAKGAKQVQACLDSHGYNHLMKVPKKWLYPLPPEPKVELRPTEERREFILVVEDMRPLRSKRNKQQFKLLTEEHLEALYAVLEENLLHDSIYIHNIPFCKDGRMAFLDLEHYNSKRRPVRYEKLTPYFSQPMQGYWQAIIHQRGQ